MDLLKKIPIVFYHSIGPIIKDWNRNYLTTDSDVFETHLKYYKKNYDVIDLTDYYNIRSGLMKSPKHPLVITIDDGFLDNWVWAFPLLKKYGIKATIFVTPEMVDPREIIRPNLEDLWKGNVKREDLMLTGYMSWQEMKLMEQSGLVDIQSHTMSHTKYFVSDELKGFHHSGADCLYPIGNLHKEQKPFHVANKNFEKLEPFGMPFFKEQSSVIAKKVTIHPDFVKECVNLLGTYDFSNYDFQTAFQKVEPLYNSYRQEKKIIVNVESDEDYQNRLKYEIVESKQEIEKRLNKKVEFLCWPHGDNSKEAHELALKNGYKATTMGNLSSDGESIDRISRRFGYRPYLKSATLGFMRLSTLINEVHGKDSAALLKKIYRLARSGKKFKE